MSKTLIIAEAGVNHNGTVEVAKRLNEVAKLCGADVVKFQSFTPELLASQQATMADYQKKNLGLEETQTMMLRKLALDKESFLELADYCKKIEIMFLSSPFDLDSIHYLNSIQPIWKIPSGEITNYPYLLEIAKTNKNIILSTGMCTVSEIASAVDALVNHGSGKITLLHCTTDYPTPMNDVNLQAMLTLKKQFDCEVGYSDHTLGIEVPIAAVAMGAKVIEKHFTLDKTMEGPDHKASLEPREFKEMVQSIRNIEMAMGTDQKRPSETELKNSFVVRKSIVASTRIYKGQMLTSENLTTKRPGTGISPMRWNDVIGTFAKRDYDEDEMIEL